ncbi:MAG: hypothetical protein NC124_15290 [Clostridium sp.]|nr:hypothetical protein [Clostridium sp.]
MKKIITLAVMCLIALPAILTVGTSYAASKTKTYKVSVTEGRTKSVKLPGKQKFYSATDSNSHVSSSGKNNSRNFSLTGISAGSSTVYVTTSKNKTLCYQVTVKADSSAAEDTAKSTETTAAAGKCPNCKKSGGLQAVSITYHRNAVKTGWLKEPLYSSVECRSMEFSSTLSEDEIANLVKSWNGVILSKFNATKARTGYHPYWYTVLLPLEYAHLNTISSYWSTLAASKNLDPYDLIEYGLMGYTDHSGHYLSEWTVEEEVFAPAQDVTIPSGLYRCSKCDYLFEKK